jgi:predicted nucleic acid-binding Zn ribbon protein
MRPSRRELSERLQRAQRQQLLDGHVPAGLALGDVTALQRLGLNASLLFLRQHWNHIAGAALAAHSVPWSLKDGILSVQTSSPLHRQELTYAAPRILRIAQDHLGEGSVLAVKAARP